MANEKISDLTALTAPADGDLLPIVDVSDLTDAPSGTTKKIAISAIFPASATDKAIPRFNGTTGKKLQNSGVIVGDVVSKNALLDLSLLASTDKTFTFPNETGTLALTSDPLLKSKVITVTRDMTAASGDVVYTGIGFVPTSIIAFGSIDGSIKMSWGMSDSARGIAVLVDIATESYADSTTYLLNLQATTNTHMQQAVVKSYDADGFTLTWTKTGSPTGTGHAAILCLK